MMHRTVVTIALIALATPVARAQPAPVDEVDQEIGRRHFERGRALYEEGRYEAAVDEFLAARRAYPAPQLDYNLARCYDRLDRPEAAIEFYQRYLDRAPTTAEVGPIRARVAVLRARLPTPPPARPHRWFVGPAVLAAAAVALAATGAGLTASVRPAYQDLEAARAMNVAPCPAGCPEAVVAPLERRAIAGYTLLGIAGAAAIGDLAWWIAAARPRRR